MEGLLIATPARALRVLYLTQWFDPEPVMKGAAFVQGLRALGFDVGVCTGFPNYPTGRLAPGYRLRAHGREVLGGARVDRVFLYPSHDGSSFGRALNYLSFFASALVFLLAKGRRFDLIYVYHPPITVGLAAALAGFATRIPFVLDVQDLWPDSVASSGMRGTGTLASALDPVCRFVYQRARRIVAQSEAMADALAARGVPKDKLDAIYNWAEETPETAGRDAPDGFGFDGEFNLVYAGNLGVAQGLDVLVRAAVLAASREPGIQLHLIGDGVMGAALAALIQRLATHAVRLHPPVPRDRIRGILEAADGLVLSLRPDPLFTLTLPSKLQFYLSVGRPILAVAEGEASRIVTGSGAGFGARPGEVDSIAEAMVAFARMRPEQRSAMGAKGRETYNRRFSFRAGLAATARTIERAAPRASAQAEPVPPTT